MFGKKIVISDPPYSDKIYSYGKVKGKGVIFFNWP
jgi:hypothetical protein